MEAIKEDGSRKRLRTGEKTGTPTGGKRKSQRKQYSKRTKEKPVGAEEKVSKERTVKERQPKETEGTVKRTSAEGKTGKASLSYCRSDHRSTGRWKEIEERAIVFLKDVFASMDLGEVEITSKYDTTDRCVGGELEGESMGILIGKRGQLWIPFSIFSLVVNKGKSNYIRVKLDTEDYRHRKETLENLTRNAYKV